MDQPNVRKKKGAEKERKKQRKKWRSRAKRMGGLTSELGL
jgi:hypothetical protein